MSARRPDEAKYRKEIERVWSAPRDLWGEEVLRRRTDPTFASVAPFMPPLGETLDAPFPGYPIVLSLKEHPEKVRLISNGSQVDLAIDRTRPYWTWHTAQIQAQFLVGVQLKPFGADAAALTGPALLDGHLPIIRFSYGVEDARFDLEVFAAPASPADPALCVYARLTAVPLRPTVTYAGIRLMAAPEKLAARDGRLAGPRGHVYVVAGQGAVLDAGANAAFHRLDLRDGQPQSLCFILPNRPEARHGELEASPSKHDTARRRLVAYWQKVLGRGTSISVPEPVVDNARKALTIGSFMLVNGDEMRYSAHNAYEVLYGREAGDAILSLAFLGYREESARYLARLMRHHHVYGGIALQEAGFKLQFAARHWQLFRDRAFLRAHIAALSGMARNIVEARSRTANGLLPEEEHCDDVHKAVYSLSQNANCWRGLRDFALLLAGSGRRAEARFFAARAAEFRAAIHRAVDASSDYRAHPPFVAYMLYGGEKPYALTVGDVRDRAFDRGWEERALGSYYNLMMPYVLDSGVFPLDDPRFDHIIEFLKRRGSLILGLLRFDKHNYPHMTIGTDDLYGMRLNTALVRRGRVREAILAFYAKLAHGMTRDTFICAETGDVFLAPGSRTRILGLPPNSASNANYLQTLRHLLVVESDRDDDGQWDDLRLLPATPRSWLGNRQEIAFKDLPTFFGPVSLRASSEIALGRIRVALTLPKDGRLRKVTLSLRAPEGIKLAGVKVNGKTHPAFDAATETVDLTALSGPVDLTALYRRTSTT